MPAWVLSLLGVTSVAAVLAAAALWVVRVVSRHTIALFAQRTDLEQHIRNGNFSRHFLFALQNLETVSFDSELDIEFTVPASTPPSQSPRSVNVYSGPHEFTDVTEKVREPVYGERTVLVLRFHELPGYDCWAFRIDTNVASMSMYIRAANQSREQPPWFRPWIARIFSERSINVDETTPRYLGPAATPTPQQQYVLSVGALLVYFGPIALFRFGHPLLPNNIVPSLAFAHDHPIWSFHSIDWAAFILLPLLTFAMYRSIRRPVNPIIQGYREARVASISIASPEPQPAPVAVGED